MPVLSNVVCLVGIMSSIISSVMLGSMLMACSRTVVSFLASPEQRAMSFVVAFLLMVMFMFWVL